MSMWSSHIPSIDLSKVKFPVLTGRENDEEESGEGQPGEGGAGAGEQNPAGSENGDGGTGDNDGESRGDPQKKITAQQEIIARKQRQLEEIGPELEELRKFKKEADEAKLSNEEKTSNRIKELEESQSKAEKALQKLVVKNAFLSSNDVVWHDPATALSLLDLSGFEIVKDEDGVPSIKDEKGFAAAIAKLAKDKPFLVKTSTSNEGDGKGGPQEWQGGKTGDAPAPRKSGEQAQRERLLKKFPALRGRS